MEALCGFASRNRSRLLALAFLAVLITGVRAYYYSGPIFANTQDEGIYLTTFAGHALSGNPVSFSQYRGADFSNGTDYLFNPADSFQFYVGLEYPIMFLQSIFGYSSMIAILYVIFTSVVEGILIFLIIDKVAGTRAGLIGAAIFAFMPVDVLFGTHVQPLVPMAMMVTASVYAFLLAQDTAKSGKRRQILFILTGLFAGFAYITNPLSLLLPAFLLLYTVYEVVLARKDLKEKAAGVCLIAAGFLIAYSLIGTVYLAQAGNFLLYPMLTRAEFNYIMLTQPLGTYCAPQILSHQVCAQYAVGLPSFYLRLLANETVPSNQYITYYGCAFLAFLAAVLLYALYLRSDRELRRVGFFSLMFLFYLLALSFLPMQLKAAGPKTIIFMADQQPYYSILFVLPMVAVLGIVIDRIMRMGGKLRPTRAILAGCLLILLIISANILVLNHDVTIYRNSMYTSHEFLDYVAAHSNGTFYAEWLFANDANLLGGYNYKIRQLSCASPLPTGQQGPSYIALGGTISMDMDPSLLTDYKQCITANATGYSVAYTVPNPYQPSSPLEILKVG